MFYIFFFLLRKCFISLLSSYIKYGVSGYVFCLSNSLVDRAHTIKYEEVGCLEFEPQPLHKLCNVPIN